MNKVNFYMYEGRITRRNAKQLSAGIRGRTLQTDANLQTYVLGNLRVERKMK